MSRMVNSLRRVNLFRGDEIVAGFCSSQSADQLARRHPRVALEMFRSS